MNPRPDRNNAVSPTAIENREDGPGPDALPADKLQGFDSFRARIEAAKRIEPKPNERHCLDCFQRGRDAAIRAILGE